MHVTNEAKDWLLEKSGLDPSTGARPLRRTIQRHIQDAISDILIHQQSDEIVDEIFADLNGDRLRFRVGSPEVVNDRS